ncbi:hemicentin-1-like [Rhipicephalus sanguineus]|uniref:hemicentin-1-like n=1 Tax=Rhipicephalus sanguineus TaxID=34632 RepID=UPI0020C43FA5|nr:hemicentin-1-like [Rhipicephalus sanguineus]
MTSMEPVSVVWFRVADVKFNLSSYLPQSGDNHMEPKKVYALVAPEPPSVTVLGASVGLVDGAHWKQPPWTGRAFFSLLSDPPALLLNRLNRSDTGQYVCNVSYRSDNVTNAGATVTEAAVELFIAVPQQPPVIRDSEGNLLRMTAGPYAEGDTVRLTCAVPAADPELKLTWRRKGQALSSPVATVVATTSGGRETHLDLGPLFREDLFLNISCVATSDVTLPMESSVLVDMFLPPAEVSVWSWPHDNADASGWVMVAPSATRTTSSALASTSARDTEDIISGTFSGRAIQSASADSSSASTFSSPRSFECEATGSRPPANITWFLDGLPLDERLSHTRVEDNVTASVLLLPSSEQAGKLLECRASNDNLREHRGVLSRYLAVNVSNKPEVSIKLGTGLNASHIMEGADVYMECSVLVASRIPHVTWSRDGRELDADLARGMVITSRYLVIRRVTPGHGGSYTCRVTNTRGDTVESTPLLIRVRYSPRCVSEEELVLSVEKDAAVNLTCFVRADPSEGLRYFWLVVNGTRGTEAARESHPNRRRQQLLLPVVTESNRLEIVPNASIFDAALACWAENAVGTQERRCRFKFIGKGVNTPALTCSVGNFTDNSFSLTCFTPLANVTTTSSTKLRPERRLRVQVFDTRRGNRSERSFWSTDLGPVLVNRLRSATEYLVVVQMPPSLAVTLTALVAIYCAHVRKKRMKKRRKPPDKECKSDTSSTSREDVDSVHIRDHKEYLAATDGC